MTGWQVFFVSVRNGSQADLGSRLALVGSAAVWANIGMGQEAT